MSVPASGPLSISDLHRIASKMPVLEESEVSLNDADMRELAGILKGPISFKDFYGKGSSNIRFEPERFILTHNHQSRATTIISLMSNGIIRYSDERVGMIEGSWIEDAPKDATIYSVVATLTSKIPPNEGIFDQHLTLDRNWTWAHTITSGFYSGQFNLDIYGADKSTPIATTNVNKLLEVEGGGGGQIPGPGRGFGR